MNLIGSFSIIFCLCLLVSDLILFPGYAFNAEHPGFNKTGTENKTQLDVVAKTQNEDVTIASSELVHNNTSGKINIYSNPTYIFLDNESGIISYGLSSFWNDPHSSCNGIFKCITNVTTGWKDNTSFQMSTTNITKKTWSWIYGQPIDVNSHENYRFVVHMKLNNWALQSHAVLEGFNEITNEWHELKQCPSGKNGPLEWQEFSCGIMIPQNTTKIRPVLNAGWSSQVGKEARTWFDSVYIVKLGHVINDPNLKGVIVYQGLELPTGIAFLGPNDLLVSEVLQGTVQRITNGVKLSHPLIDLDVASREGLLGIAVQKNISKTQAGLDKEITYVFLYFTAAKKDGGKALGNVLYRYELVNNKLVNPKLLLELPAGFEHNGGKLLIGPDNYIYLMVGEIRNKTSFSNEKNKALNNQSKYANEPDGRGGILRIDQNGQPVGPHGILGDYSPLNKYYAYGIRNSFGMDFDPVTGKLWDTENGPDFGDEINLVKPGFDSGWRKVQGIWNVLDGEKQGSLASENPNNLVDFNGKGKYSSPEFTWNPTVGPTALKFLTTDKLGKQYENDMFVADADNGRIYHFKLNQNRTALFLQGPLQDKVADTDSELDNVTFAQGFGLITDLEVGPDGYLYVLSHDQGRIYRIAPNDLDKDVIQNLD